MDENRLGAWLQRALPDWQQPAVSAPAPLRAGWESDVYRLAITHGPSSARVSEQVVLRVYVGDQGPAKAVREFTGMKLLGSSGYPVPRAIAVEPEPDALGRPFMLMDFVDGDAEWGWDAVRDDPQRRSTFVGLLRRLHSVDWRPLADPADHAALRAGRGIEITLAEWKLHLDAVPLPGFADLYGWIDAASAAVPRIEPAVVHLDYHVGNVLVSADRPEAWVVDWTQVGVTDPRFDVAWTSLLMAESQGQDVVRAEYERSSGPLPAMEFFAVAMAWKRLSTVVVSLRAGPEAMGMRPEAANLMRDQLGAIAGTYGAVSRTTGVRLPSVEALLG